MSGNRNDVLQHIENPLDNDVLGGRGGASYKHKGNIAYRRLVQLSKSRYALCQKREKMQISKCIVHAIKTQDPPGRFLEKDSKNGLWKDVGEKKAIEKTSQALREDQPHIRRKMKKLNANNFPKVDVINASSYGVARGVIAASRMNSFTMNNNQRSTTVAPVAPIDHRAMGMGEIPAYPPGSCNREILAHSSARRGYVPDSNRTPQMNGNQISQLNRVVQSDVPQNNMALTRPVPASFRHQH